MEPDGHKAVPELCCQRGHGAQNSSEIPGEPEMPPVR